MSKIQWDVTGEHWYQTGVDKVALYKFNGTRYGAPIAWNGVTAITESPSGAESNKQYADNIAYLNLISAEEFGATLEAFQSPEEFDECDGEASVASTNSSIAGIKIKAHAARRVKFALAWRVLKGNDNDSADTAIAENGTNKFVYHIIYGCTAAPSSRDNNTVNDSPEAVTLSWEIDTLPIADTDKIGQALINAGVTKVAHLEFEVSSAEEAEAIEALLYDNGRNCPWPYELTGDPGSAPTYYSVVYGTADETKGTVAGTIPSGDRIAAGESFTLTATAKSGHTFSGWFAPGSDDPVSTDAEYTVASANGNVFYQAQFT